MKTRHLFSVAAAAFAMLFSLPASAQRTVTKAPARSISSLYTNARLVTPATRPGVTMGYDSAGGFKTRTSVWTAKGTKFRHVSYYSSNGKLDYHVRYAKSVKGGQDTVRYAAQGAADKKTKGPAWTAKGTTLELGAAGWLAEVRRMFPAAPAK